MQLYERFIAGFEAKINQLKLVQIVAKISAQFFPSRPYVPAGVVPCPPVTRRRSLRCSRHRARRVVCRVSATRVLCASLPYASLLLQSSTAPSRC
jgi:primosomal replication protein N